jgi:hypothetical protein
MENITLAQDVAALWFIAVFGAALLTQVIDFARRCWK